MRYELLKEIKKAKYEICKSVYKQLKSKENNIAFFINEPCYFYVVESANRYDFERMFIEGETVMVEYTVGNGYEPCEYKREIDELSSFELGEICEIIKRLRD